MVTSTARVNGIALSYSSVGSGEPVLCINPAASRARIWETYQVPALVAAGFRVVTFDSRGTAPSSVPPGPYRLPELAADAAGLLDELGLGPCHVVGASLGAMTAQELALARPDLVRSTALLATRGRTDVFRGAMATAGAEAARASGAIPPRYAALSTVMQLLSPVTLLDDRASTDWIELLTAFPIGGEGAAAQYEATVTPDRLAALSGLNRPTLVAAFADDVLIPPTLVREVADAIPDSEYVEVPDCGHYGFLERPHDVNKRLVEFFRRN